jgi:hypothetical protein
MARASVPWRTQPPAIAEPPEGRAPLDYMGDEEDRGGSNVVSESEWADGGGVQGLNENSIGDSERLAFKDPQQEADDEGGGDEEDLPDFQLIGKNAFRTSTTYFDSNFRKDLDNSLRAFNNQHPSDSKYNSETFNKRSKLYRPKTRTIMRKNEAALCSALFSNLDLIETAAVDGTNKEEIVSADVMKEVLQQRLTVSIPWFKFSIGGLQDAMNQGPVIAHNYWCHRGITRQDGKYVVLEDRPCMELVPLENLRFDPSASWLDPINTSPFLIQLIPMYIGDVKERMNRDDPKGRRWRQLSDDVLMMARDNSDDSTRAARTNQNQDASQQDRDVTNYDIVWVHRHIHRWQGEDFEWYMLASKHMLTEPEPLGTNVWFGERPYVMGAWTVETHKAMPASLPTLGRGLQDETNDIGNQRSDNVKLVLNKRWFAKRSANVDTNSLVRNVPGGVTMVNDVEKDVKEVTWPDVTQSAYEEQNRVDGDFDALLGNFNPMAAGAGGRNPRESTRTMLGVQAPSMMMTEYTLMTYVQTFLLPCLRQLVLLEQYYESDMVLLAVAGQKAKIAQRFGVNEVTDAILEKRIAVNINIGMGATDPVMKMNRFQGAVKGYTEVCAKPPPGLDLKEVGKEFMALAGYQDGMRFFNVDDPDKLKMTQTIALLQKKLAMYEQKVHDKHESNVVKLQTSREANLTKLIATDKTHMKEGRHLLVGHLMQLEMADRQAEQQRQQQELQGEQAITQQNQGQAGQMALQAAKPSPNVQGNGKAA